MKLMIINGSVREGRMSDKIQAWALEILEQDKDLDVDIVDLKEVDLPFFNELVIPAMAKGQYENPQGTAWAKRVAEADAFIMLAAEYNHGPTAVLKNAIDWVNDGWMHKPVGFIGYGAMAGGSRAVQQLKQNVLNVKMYPTHMNLHIPLVWQAFDDKGQPIHAGLSDGLKQLVVELKDLQKRLVR